MAGRRIPKGTRELPATYVSPFDELYKQLEREAEMREEQRLTRGGSLRTNQFAGWQGGQ